MILFHLILLGLVGMAFMAGLVPGLIALLIYIVLIK